MFLHADLPEARPIARLNATMQILGLLPGGIGNPLLPGGGCRVFVR